MTFGIQVFDGDGNMWVNLNTDTVRFLAPVSVNVPTSGSVNVTVTGAVVGSLAVTDLGATAKVTALNTATVYGGAGASGTTNVRVMLL